MPKLYRPSVQRIRESSIKNYRYTLNDLRQNRSLNLVLLVVLSLSACLMAAGSIVMERLVSSVDALFEQAKPPHFLQMHKGSYDQTALEAFATTRPEIDQWLIEEMIGFDSAALAWERPATGESGQLSNNLIDNLFVSQNQTFDFLLDEAGRAPIAEPGQVYLPVAYRQSSGINTGDQLVIQTATKPVSLQVVGFVRDAQMASSLSSATRFLVSKADLTTLTAAGGGNPEVIVEYRLTNPALASTFQSAYQADVALPQNGQAVTYAMIRLINAISDGLVAIALIFISLVLVLIAVLNVRFVIQGKLEEEVRQIGAMKAIGLPHSTIANLYLAKYFILMLVACVAGGTLATLAAVPLTRSIATNYAAAPIRPTTFFVPLIALTLLFCLVLVICRALLSKINRIEVVNAMVHGSTLSTSRQIRANRRRAHRMSRSVFSRGSLSSHINYRLALVDLRRELRRWLLLPLVFLLATVLMTLPTNLLTTLTSPQFATYMGGVDCDIRFDLQFSDDIDQVRTKLLEALEQDARITTVHQYAEQLVEIDGLAGPERLRVAVGDYSGETVAFTEGHPPRAGEIAFSVLNAEKYHLDVGDQLTVNESTQKRNLVISGIYQDITSGGYTAKMQGIPAAGASRYVLYADTRRDSNVSSSTHPKLVAQAYQTQFPSVSIVPMQEYVGQTLSHLTSALSNAAVIAVVFALGVSSLITFFYLGLQLSRDRQRLGVLAALGFSNQELDTQMRVKALIAVFSGVLLGLATTVTLGQALVGSAFALTGLGISDLAFSPSLGLVYLLYPLLLIAVGFLSTLAVGTGLRRSNPIGWVRS